MKKIILGVIALVVAICIHAQLPVAAMESLVDSLSKAQKINGVVFVASKGKVIFSRATGFSDFDKRTPNRVDNVFQIGSITKQITAAVIMQLQQEKKLSISDPLSKYYSGFPNGDQITIHHLLNHTSGLYNYTNDTILLRSDVTRPRSREEMLKIFRSYPPDFAPGTKWNYSNTGYSMLGYIIEKVEKKPYEAVVRQRIFSPLEMTHSGFDFRHLQADGKTKGYFAIGYPSPIVDSTIAFSAGAVYSTVEDLYKWERGIRSGRVLHDSSWKAVFTPGLSKYGYGWNIDTLFGRRATMHSGGIHGYTSFLLRFPEDDLVVIALDNGSSRELSKLSKNLAAIAFNEKVEGSKTIETKLPAGTLAKYAGEYELAPNFIIRVFLQGNSLMAQATGQPSFELFAEKEDHFFVKVVEAKVEFVKDASGSITEMILYQNGQAPHGKKIR